MLEGATDWAVLYTPIYGVSVGCHSSIPSVLAREINRTEHGRIRIIGEQWNSPWALDMKKQLEK